MKYHGVTDYLETKRDIETNKLNVEYFKHSIYCGILYYKICVPRLFTIANN